MAPPRTLNPPPASPTDLTPGRVRIILTTSASPKTTGTFFMRSILTFSIPISLLRTLLALSAETTTPVRAYTFSCTTISRLPSLYTTRCTLVSSREYPLTSSDVSPSGRRILYKPAASDCAYVCVALLKRLTPITGSPVLESRT